MANSDPDRLPDNIPFEDILRALRLRDQATWTTTLARLTPHVREWLQRKFGDNEVQMVSVDEAVQSAWRTMFRRIPEGELDLDSWDALAGYLVRVAWNKVRRMFRQSRGISLPALSDETDPSARTAEPAA